MSWALGLQSRRARSYFAQSSQQAHEGHEWARANLGVGEVDHRAHVHKGEVEGARDCGLRRDRRNRWSLTTATAAAATAWNGGDCCGRGLVERLKREEVVQLNCEVCGVHNSQSAERRVSIALVLEGANAEQAARGQFREDA